MKDNIFITGIPTELNVADEVINNPESIIKHVLEFVAQPINCDDYKIFKPREGNTRHSAKLVFTSNEVKRHILLGSKKLNLLERYDVRRKIFIKNETTPLVRKENDRLYKKLKELKNENPNAEHRYKITKGKLMKDDHIIGEFNIANSIS